MESGRRNVCCRVISLLFPLSSLLFSFSPLSINAQKLTFSQPHGFCEAPFSLTIDVTGNALPEGAVIRYTLDGSVPTLTSKVYTQPLDISTTTILRAAAFSSIARLTTITTATWIFAEAVLKQSDHPEGYPEEWGKYSQINGTAKADYGMDPEMTNDPVLAPKIIEGLKSLPVLSIVTDKNNLFSHENDEETGGIYIFTGPPVGDATGHGWTRAASVELMGGTMQHDLTIDCGLRLHGGHGRLAEKNPKHSFRLVFKSEYGPKSLDYPLYGAEEPKKFDQLVLRCHFGNSWQHWDSGNRQRAQYTRDDPNLRPPLWDSLNEAKTQMLWGLSQADVVKIAEDGGNHHEASEGTLDAWNQMIDLSKQASKAKNYQQLQALLDIDNFIDYMLINQYAGNTDWAHHNWYAILRRGTGSQGFRFLCWDSEVIFENVYESVLEKNNVSAYPTGLFQNLLKNDDFADRYGRRARELLSDNGLLGPESVVETWDSLYHVISKAIYAEAARWGDYRRYIHQYKSKGKYYTVDDYYMAERNRLLNEYFPYRSAFVLADIQRLVPSGIQPVAAPEADNRLFNLQGQQVQHPSTGLRNRLSTGIYIRDGKKVIVKE